MRHLRMAQRMTLTEFAVIAGMAKGHLSSIENGLASITAETVERIATALGISPMYLFAFPEDDERARIADLLLTFPLREVKKLRIELFAKYGPPPMPPIIEEKPPSKPRRKRGPKPTAPGEGAA